MAMMTLASSARDFSDGASGTMKQALGHNGICHVYGHARLQPLLQTSVIRTTSVLTLRRSTCMRITNVYRFNSDSHSCDDDVGGNSCAEEEAQHQPTRKQQHER